MDESMVSGNYFGRDYSLSDQEESSWTVYIDDFEEGRFHDDYDSSSSSSLSDEYDESSTSMVSNGGSSLAVPLTKKKKQVGDGNLCLNNLSSARKSLKRRRSSVDPDLEDTATSPPQSLQVIDLNQFIKNSSEEMNDKGIFQVQEYNLFKSPKKESNMKSLQKSLSISQQEIMSNYYTNELRRKGLSLVPLSLLFSHTTTASCLLRSRPI